MRPDRLRPDTGVRDAIPGDDATGLARAEDELAPAQRGEDRRGLEVVVAHVVARHLVVPEQLAARPGQDDQRVGVERGPGEGGAVRQLLRAAPRPRVGDAGVDVAALVHADRVPEAAAAGLRRRPGLLDRFEAPDGLTRAGRQRVERPPPARREALRAHIDAAAVDNRGNADELLVRADEQVRPEPAAGARIEGERRRIRGGVDGRADDREAVGAVVRRSQRDLPARAARTHVQGVDARGRVLDVDGIPPQHRVGGDGAEAGAAPWIQGEAPAHPQAADRARRDRGGREGTGARDGAVRSRPGASSSRRGGGCEQGKQRRARQQRCQPASTQHRRPG